MNLGQFGKSTVKRSQWTFQKICVSLSPFVPHGAGLSQDFDALKRPITMRRLRFGKRVQNFEMLFERHACTCSIVLHERARGRLFNLYQTHSLILRHCNPLNAALDSNQRSVWLANGCFDQNTKIAVAPQNVHHRGFLFASIPSRLLRFLSVC